jgi:fusion and transport protein UGO1
MLIFPTILHSTVQPFITQSIPLFLRSRLGLDPFTTPGTYGFCTFLSQTLELFLRLPLETVLRRGQMSYLQHSALVSGMSATGLPKTKTPPAETIVDIGPYRGVLGTMWAIVREEQAQNMEIVPGDAGAPATRRAKKGARTGQGVEGLWRGWRVGMWGIVGVWGSGLLGSGKGGEF